MIAPLVELPIPPNPVSNDSSLQDVVEYAGHEEFADVWWLKKLRIKRRRTDVRCLGLSTRIGKRSLDIVVASTMLIVLSPLFLLVAVLVKITSRGPVIFQQTRVGLNLRRVSDDRRQLKKGPPVRVSERRTPESERRTEFAYGRHFTLYKFRTMRTDAEKNGAQFAVKGDPRVTSIGWFMRKTRIDELPQLWNVLKGEMSLVGPRPERPEFMKELSDQIPNYLDRLGLKPGLTGVAQILNGYDNQIESFRRKVAFDLHYLQNCSVLNDIKILIRTISVILTGSGAL